MHLGNRTAQPRCYHNAFYGWQFREPRRGGNSDFAILCACVCESGRHGHTTAACVLQTHTCIITVSVTQLCSSFGLELMVKLRTLLTVFTFIWKLKLAIMERGVTFPTRACGVRPITMHCVRWPIRADCACRKEGLCRKRSVWERRGIEDLQ